MSGFKTVSRSQLYNDSDDEQSSSSNNEDYTLPPPTFDFEIVDIDDHEEENRKEDNSDDEKVEEGEKKDKVEFFPLFSTSSTSNSNNEPNNTTPTNNNNNNNGLVKIKVDNVDDIVDEVFDTLTSGNNTANKQIKDEEWDQIAKERNKSARPLNYYFQDENLKDENNAKYQSVAVDGDTIIQWSEKFRVISNYKVIDITKFNSKIDLYYRQTNEKNKVKKHNRSGKKKRDAKIFKKERIREWKQKLKDAKERAKRQNFKDYNINTKSTKKRFGDSFKKRINTVPKSKSSSSSISIFRTE